MERLNNSVSFFIELNEILINNDDKAALDCIEKNKSSFDNYEDLSLIFLNSGFLNYKLGDYTSSIENFSKAIEYEKKIGFFILRSKDIAYSGRSNSKYMSDDFKGAIEDKREAIKIRLLEDIKFMNSSNILDYRNIILDAVDISKIEAKYFSLIKSSKIKRNKYDLIYDFKKVITDKRKNEVINKLEQLSEIKFNTGDFKGSIKALRRAEKYY